MDFEWVAIALGDVVWIAVAFALGLLSRSVGLPPLVGYLATGFLIGSYGIVSGEMLQKLADLGITLLLFTVGLKLNLRTLARPQVWAVTSLHISITILLLSLLLYGLILFQIPIVAELELAQILLIAFALSFSSTVFVVKVLEEKSEMKSLHGRIAIGILIVQDIAAVIFIAASTGKTPSISVLLLLLLIPLRPVLFYLMKRVGHGELLVLYGLLLSLGGAEIFELVGMKGDVGALILGVIIASHARAAEMAKTMLGFKDLFLLGFFLSIGLSGQPSQETMLLASLLTVFVLFKSILFYVLLVTFKLRARTSLLTTINLSNYSEFGLIVAAISVTNGWIDSSWLTVLAISISLSFVIAAVLNVFSHEIYALNRPFWKRMQRTERLDDDSILDIKDNTIAIIGMGRVGSGAYDKMQSIYGDTVVGIDFDPVTISYQLSTGKNILLGDPSDADFWDRITGTHTLKLVMLTLPNIEMNLSVLKELSTAKFDGRVVAAVRYSDEVERLEKAGVNSVFNIYTEAGAGFAAHVVAKNQ
ncbi:MAG: cation:proton antiporter [Gammaproteobacteria bacterium]|jgi:glutathione-regulated potassium-efflux system ancillary protein KefC|nr:cation:proton antiporter [Gammaproteobacteria bacterium]